MKNIYLHIPFCLKKCSYCSFNSLTDLSFVDDYIKMLCREIATGGELSGDRLVNTVYFGGGTPGLLSPVQLELILKQLRQFYNFAGDIELSMEVNPETVTMARLLEYRDLGVNRLSIGVQSFNDDELKYLGRIHSANKARSALNDISKVFENWNLDLIMSIPGQTTDSIEGNIKEAAHFSPKHISCYELTVEEGTPLALDPRRFADDGESYLFARDLLVSLGFWQYEISNYAKKGFECRHNLAYWSNLSYVGFGLSAHSFDRERNVRSANTGDIRSYLDGNYLDFVEPSQEIDRFIMGLRKREGLEISEIPVSYAETIESLVSRGLLQRNKKNIAFTEKGMLLANRVLVELMEQ